MNTCARLIVALAVTVASGSVHAEVYRWVDEQGNVQFGDQPTQKDNPEQVKVPTFTPDPNTLERLDNQKRYLDARQTDREKDAEQKKKDEERAKEYAKACEESKKRLALLEGGARLYTETGAVGERHYLSDEERAKEVASTNEKIKEYCSGPPKK